MKVRSTLSLLLLAAFVPLAGITQCGDADMDGDGYSIANGDCDDGNAWIYPGAPELCDGYDNDCDGAYDEDTPKQTLYPDLDGDAFGAGEPLYNCQAVPGYVLRGDDCDDSNPKVWPGAPEEVDGVDNDCDGLIDETAARGADADGDGYATPEDCDDNDAAVNPGKRELWGDGEDTNCDGLIGLLTDGDGDGYGQYNDGLSVMGAPNTPGYTNEQDGDCNDADPTVYRGAAETCGDGIDSDCGYEESDACPSAVWVVINHVIRYV